MVKKTMNTKIFKVNLDLLKKIYQKKHCLCNLNRSCPCKLLIERNKCECGVFTW